LGPLIERGFNLLSNVLDGLPGLFTQVSDAVDSVISPLTTLIAVAQRFGLQAPEFFGFLVKFFGPETAQDIKRVTDALAELDFKRVADELLNNILSGGQRLGQIIQDEIVQPVVDWVKDVDWAEVGSKALELYTQLLKVEFEMATWIVDNLVVPIANAIAEVDWSQVGSALGDIVAQIFSGAVDIGRWVYIKITSKIKAALSDETAIQEIFQSAGEITRKVISGLGDGLGSVASWIKTNVIDAAITALSGGGAGDGRGGGGGGSFFDTAAKIGKAILDGIASYFLSIAQLTEWIATNVLAPFITGLTGVDLTQVIDQGKAIGQSLIDGIGNLFSGENEEGETLADWVQTNVIDNILDTITNSIDSIIGAGKELGQALLDGMLEILKALPRELVQLINDAIPDKIQFDTPVGSISIDIPPNPVPLPTFARGGVLRGLGIVGENGPELAYAAQPTAIMSNSDSTAMLDAFGINNGTAQSGGGGGDTIIEKMVIQSNARNYDQLVADIERHVNRKNQTILAPLRGTT
jgi:hypothetical protein